MVSQTTDGDLTTRPPESIWAAHSFGYLSTGSVESEPKTSLNNSPPNLRHDHEILAQHSVSVHLLLTSDG